MAIFSRLCFFKFKCYLIIIFLMIIDDYDTFSFSKKNKQKHTNKRTNKQTKKLFSFRFHMESSLITVNNRQFIKYYNQGEYIISVFPTSDYLTHIKCTNRTNNQPFCRRINAKVISFLCHTIPLFLQKRLSQ